MKSKKKRFIFFVIYFFLLNFAFSLDIPLIEDAIIDYTPNSKSKSYTSALYVYGFTDTQINAWRFTNTFIDQYYNQIYQVLSGKKYENVPHPGHHIGTIRAVGEVKENNLENLINFFNDTYYAAQQMNNERIKELDKKVIERNDVIIIYGFNIIYDGNGNTSGEVPADEILYRSGTLIELKNSESLEKEGYKFMGWSENKDSSSWINSNKMNIQRDITLYAVWIDLDTLNQQTASQVIQQKQNTERNQNVGYTVYSSLTY